jgi:hypothetical protein
MISGMIPARFNFRILLTCSVFKVAEKSIDSLLEQAVATTYKRGQNCEGVGIIIGFA